MRSKLALILALVAVLALAVVGSTTAAMVEAKPLPKRALTESVLPGNSSTATATEPATGTTTTPSSPSAASTGNAPQCADGVDNDGDGLIDMEDPDCSSPNDDSEGP